MRFAAYLLFPFAAFATTATAMPASQFILDWRAASKGPVTDAPRSAEMAAADPRIQKLATEFSAALGRYRGELLEARAAGKPTRSCPPKKLSLTVDDMIAEIERLPTFWQHREFSDAFAKAMDIRYPCAASAQAAKPGT